MTVDTAAIKKTFASPGQVQAFDYPNLATDTCLDLDSDSGEAGLRSCPKSSC